MGIKRQIVAFGGGGFSMESGNPLLDDFVCGLTGLKKPRVCFLPTASGDADHYVVRFYNNFRTRSEPSHISLFRREKGVEDIRDHLLSQDLIYVGGGSVISMLGVWRAHGIDEILREAWERGIILCGLSAGSLCWFDEGLTGYQDASKRVLGLGFLPFSNMVHFKAGSDRHKVYESELKEGLRPGFAAADGAALHFVDTQLAQVVASRPEARAYGLELRGDHAKTTQIATRFLGNADHTPLVGESSLPWSSSPLAA
ncbi:MAG: Type 1 glutamine amidotransferase-like domain-containing protein [Solirubrobacterales bacterium]